MNKNVDVCCNDCINFERAGLGLGRCIAAESKLEDLGFPVKLEVKSAWDTVSDCSAFEPDAYAQSRLQEAEVFYSHG